MVSGRMLLGMLLGALLFGGLIVYVVLIYNGLIRLRNNIEKAWSNIDVLLKQRADELPKLIDTVREYMDYERDILQDLTDARTGVEQAQGPAEEAAADQTLRGALSELSAVAEDYPELQASDNFQQLQDRIASLEEQIADRREFYNDSVNTYNIRIDQIPYNIVAILLGYREKELFAVNEEDTQDINIDTAFDTADGDATEQRPVAGE